jgi:low temperature requirement protein LtrA
MIFGQLTGALIFAAGVPDFIKGNLMLGVIGYVVMRVAMIVQWLRAARSNPTSRATAYRYVTGISLCQVAWVLLLFFPKEWYYAGFFTFILMELLVPV